MKIFRYIIIPLLISWICSDIIVSQDITPPERPMITYVTVDTSTNNTLIFWDESNSTDVMWYYLYYEIETVNGMEGVKLDSISPGNSSYVHAGDAGIESMIYSISAIDSSGNESLRTPGFHSTVYTTVEYDSCQDAINISWNKYIGWGDNISGYRVYYRAAGEPYSPAAGVGKNDSTYRFENIRENTPYFFFVEALKNDTLVSSSNLAEKYTYMPGAPADFNLVNVNVTAPGIVEINFEFNDTSSINDFRLLRSFNKNSDFISVGTRFDLSSGTNSFTDTIDTGSDRFYYKIGALNSCNQVFQESNTGTNIILSGENDGNENQLNWTFYEDWEEGVEEYQVYRIDNQGNSILLYSSGNMTNSYNHNLLNVYGDENEGLVNYQVLAKKTGEDIFSASNILQLDISSKIAVPNAFTPNGDGKNDTFKPIFTLLPEKYLMVIYDRYGIIVYETKNPTEGWDGRINGGEMAIEGVYVYHIQYTSYTGTSLEKTGQLTVFYP
jgi:gliding motility-associated-like protein